jgi:hypothetical protein
MNKEITVPKGKDFVSISASGHKYIRLVDAEGNEIFRSNSPGESITAIVDPGRYNVDTDGKVDKVDYGALDERYRNRRPLDAGKPPDAGKPAR